MATGLGIRGIVNQFNAIILSDGMVEKEDLIFMIKTDIEIPDKYKSGEKLELLVDNLINPAKYSTKIPRSLEENHKERLELYKQGLNDVEIADKQGHTVATISNWRYVNNLPSNDKEQYKKVHEARMKLYKKGKTDRQIADIENVNIAVIQSWRYRNKLKVNRG